MSNGYSGGPGYPHPGHQPGMPSPQSPRPSRRWVPWVFGAGGLVVIALAVVIILLIANSGDSTPNAKAPSATASNGSNNATGPNGSNTTVIPGLSPEPCGPSKPGFTCFPQSLTPESAAEKLRSLGAQCDTTTLYPKCQINEPTGDTLSINVIAAPTDNPRVLSIDFQYFSPSKGQTPESQEKAVSGLVDGVQKAFAALLPNATDLSQQIAGWLRTNIGSCPDPLAMAGPNVAGYEVGCTNPAAKSTSAANDVLWSVGATVNALAIKG